MSGYKMRVTSVRREYVDHETQLWCNRCMLATGARLWIAWIAPNGMFLQERLWCYEHEGSDGVVTDGD